MSSTTIWYTMRASGVVALVLLSATMTLGILTAGRAKSRTWPAFAQADLHKRISIIAMVFLTLHVRHRRAGHVRARRMGGPRRAVRLGVPTVLGRPGNGQRRPHPCTGDLRGSAPAHQRPDVAGHPLGRLRQLAGGDGPLARDGHRCRSAVDGRPGGDLRLRCRLFAGLEDPCGPHGPKGHHDRRSRGPGQGPDERIHRSPHGGQHDTRSAGSADSYFPGIGPDAPRLSPHTTRKDVDMTTLTATRTGRLLTADGAQTTLGDHLAIHGPLSLAGDTEDASRSRFFEEIAASGLFGRGGAAFPTSRKWETMSRSRRRPVVVVNAMEGEPASSKDHVLLTRSPHLVVDGAEVAADAVNAAEMKICVAASNAVAATLMERAVGERRRSGLVRCPVTVHRTPGRYVAGEESALVSWLDKGRALPAFRPDKSVPLELSRRPALVHNAETMSHIALIARNGAAWFRQRGTAEAPGSSLVTISGAVDTPGVLKWSWARPSPRCSGGPASTRNSRACSSAATEEPGSRTSLLDVPYTPPPCPPPARRWA